MSILKPKGDRGIEAMRRRSHKVTDDVGPQGSAEVFRKLPVNAAFRKEKFGAPNVQ